MGKQLLLNSMFTKIKPNTFLSGRFKCEQCPRRTTMASFKKEKKKSNSDPKAKVVESGACSNPCLQGRSLELPQQSAWLPQLPSKKS